MFIWDDNDLNAEQVDAITDDNNILLVACPGSGKTRTLTYKIAFELSKLTETKKYIIAITYTNRAADEIKDRIELLGVNTKQLWIGTIHAFCLEWILRPYSLYIPRLKKGFRVINSYDSEKIITELCHNYNKSHGLIRRSKITYWDCGYIATPKPGFKITTSNIHKKDSVKTILKEYFNILRGNNQIDFELILFYTLKLLREYPIISSIISKIFPYILVDEYQDTKEIQYHIISYIIKKSEQYTNIFIVGDPNQSIYQTLGGFPIEESELEKLCEIKIEQLKLSKNYRSSKKIIDYFEYFKTFANNNEAIGVNKDYESQITLNRSIVKDDLIDEIVRLIVLNIEEYGISQNEICVVAPQWVHLASVTRKLMLKLPDCSFDGPGMAPFSRDIDNFWFKLSRVILTEPSPNLYIRRLRWSSEIIHDLNNADVDTSHMDKKRFLKLCNSIKIEETDGLKYLEEFFKKLFSELLINIPEVPTLIEHYNSFFDSSKKRIDRLLKDGINYISDIETFKKVFKQRKGITVSTYHGVKGAEYDTVIAFALLQDYIPHFSDTNGVGNSKKLLYVITSRARKNLYLIAERKRFKNFGSPPPEYVVTQHIEEYDYKYDV